jgi:hypothetical protein
VNGIPNRVVRLVTLVSVAAVSILGSTQAMAAAPMSYYQGSGDGSALAVVASPDAVLNLRLTAINSILAQLATATGVDLNSVVGGTLANPTAPINVVIDQAHSVGKSATGQSLTAGTSTTTPLSIDAASLNQELALLKAALKNVPAGAVGQVTSLLNNLPTSSSTASVLAALNQLAGQLADTLGNPAVNAFDSATINFGDLPNPVNNGNLTAGPSFLTTGPFVLGPFSAEALPKDSLATNTLTSLDLAPTGRLGVPSAASIQQLLSGLANSLATLETNLGTIVTVLPVAGGALGGVIQTVTPNVNAALQAAINAVNTAYATLVNALSAAFNALGLINNLQLNDLLGTGPSTALSSTTRDLTSGVVSANGLSQLAHVDVLKLSNPLLAGLLNKLTSASGGNLPDLTNTSLVSLDGVKGTATATADGSTTHETATGQLVDVHVLGQSLKALTGNLDNILPPGTTCTIQVPGVITCPGLAGGQAAAALSALNTVLGNIPTSVAGLITITLTRGANVDTAGPDLQHAAASIVTLEVNVAIDCSKVPALATIQSLAAQVPLVNMTLCSGGSAPAFARTAHVTSAPAGSSSLVDLQLGQADAAVSLTPAPANFSGTSTHIPATGNNIWILAAFGLVLAAAGIAINRRRIPVRG